MASYSSLAFGRYVVEPFFEPCSAPTVLIKVIGILGFSEWFYTYTSSYPQCYYTTLYAWADYETTGTLGTDIITSPT